MILFPLQGICHNSAQKSPGPKAVAQKTIEVSAFKNIAWRNIGPCNMGGRISDIEGIPGHPDTLYFGTASGGLWKTTNGGITNRPLFDQQPVQSIGDLALDPSNPDVIWVGTGEDNPRNSVSFGNGVHRSTDGGESWKHMGLADTQHISRVVVHPHNSDIVYVAAVGHAFGPNKERGIFMTLDGGQSWRQVLYVDDETGASDLEIDPSNPNILYAGMWTFVRKPWTFRSGSEKGGLFKSVDGGRTWKKLVSGLPRLVGRIGVKVAPSNPQVVYTIMEAKDGTLFRSQDRGETWQIAYKEWDIVSRGFYYAEMRVDPKNENRVFAISGGLRVSIDGGRTFRSIAQKLHVDHHTLWIDPADSRFLADGNDGGVGISRDAGENWVYLRNMPLGQYYQIAADNQAPFYMVYGGLQDNGSWGIKARSRNSLGISNDELISIGGGDGFFVAVHAQKPNLILSDSQGGSLSRFDTRTGNSQAVTPFPVSISGGPASDAEYRFDWGAPIVLSPHDPQTAYFGGNVLFQSTDFGKSWRIISPDLTTNDKEKQKNSGGPVLFDNTTAEFHCVILDISESPLTPGLIWIGTDDTQVQLTRDGGKTWTNLSRNISGLPSEAIISHVEASITNSAAAYVTADRHQLDDFRPYVFKTEDFGKTWRNITGDLPATAYVHVIREDRKNPKVLFVGTEIGVFVSLSGGNQWVPLKMKNMPEAVSVHDLLVHPQENDLVVGTHGRSLWVLDDIGFLQQMTPEALSTSLTLFSPRKAWRHAFWSGDSGGTVIGGDMRYWGPNPEYGALITYFLKDVPDEKTPVKIQILDAQGNPVREINGTNLPGINRVAWDLRYEGPMPRTIDGDPARGRGFRTRGGPQALPGEYSIKLTAGDQTAVQKVELDLDPALEASRADLEAQLAASLKLRDMISSMNLNLRKIDSVEQQVKNLQEMSQKKIADPPADVKQALDGILEKILKSKESILRQAVSSYDAPGRLYERLSGLMSSVDRGNAAPTPHQLEYLQKFEAECQRAVQNMAKIVEEDVPALNQILLKNSWPTILMKAGEN